MPWCDEWSSSVSWGWSLGYLVWQVVHYHLVIIDDERYVITKATRKEIFSLKRTMFVSYTNRCAVEFWKGAEKCGGILRTKLSKGPLVGCKWGYKMHVEYQARTNRGIIPTEVLGRCTVNPVYINQNSLNSFWIYPFKLSWIFLVHWRDFNFFLLTSGGYKKWEFSINEFRQYSYLPTFMQASEPFSPYSI